jgi:hypothetical protein
VDIDCDSVKDGIAWLSEFVLFSGGYAVCGEENALCRSLPQGVSGAGNEIYRNSVNRQHEITTRYFPFSQQKRTLRNVEQALLS